MDPEQPETLVVGKNFILMYCYRIVTADTRAQVFGTYSYSTAKDRFEHLEHPAKSEKVGSV